jgi:hypothetical protein
MTDTEPTTVPEVPDEQKPYDRTWILVPVIAFGGVLFAWALPSLESLPGTLGCILASCLLAYLAYLKPRKDIVSLLTPLYAVLIFLNESLEPSLLLLIQALYAASLTILVFRLNARFSRKDEVKERFTDPDQESTVDESLSE